MLMDGLQGTLDNGHECLQRVTMTLEIVVYIAHVHCSFKGHFVYQLHWTLLCVVCTLLRGRWAVLIDVLQSTLDNGNAWLHVATLTLAMEVH